MLEAECLTQWLSKGAFFNSRGACGIVEITSYSLTDIIASLFCLPSAGYPRGVTRMDGRDQ